MVKLATLKPRIARADLRIAQPLTTQTQRVTGRRLQRRNERLLRAHPLCVTCAAEGRVAAAQELDHIVPLHRGGQDEESNLQGLCVACHKAKSAEESRERGYGV